MTTRAGSDSALADLLWAGVETQAAALRAAEVTAGELVRGCFERLHRAEPRLRAFRTLREASAREEAAAADAALAAAAGGAEPRPLLGVPLAIKDNQRLTGLPAFSGTASPEQPASSDDEVVRRLRAAGAVVVGTTTLPELALWPFTVASATGVTRNPWHLGSTTGGSSGGSAAAVAAGIVPAATASDGGGSIRIPAACCGLVGLKPTPGRVPVGERGGEEHWWGLSSYGVLTRRVRDTALLLDLLADAPAGWDGTLLAAADRNPGQLTVGWTFTPPGPNPSRVAPDEDVRDGVDRVLQALRAAGHRVTPCTVPWGDVLSAFLPRFLRGGYDDARRLADPSRLERRTRQVAWLGARVPESLAARARDVGSPRAAARLGSVFNSCDVLVTPTTAAPAGPAARYHRAGLLATVDGATRGAAWTSPWNTVGFPAVSLPAGFSADGRPVAAQLIAPPDREPLLVSVAAQLESVLRWPERYPPL